MKSTSRRRSYTTIDKSERSARAGKAQSANKKSTQRNARASTSTTLRPGPSSAFPIVAIGASAGGLEAFTNLLKELPADTGMAFVLIQHLDPKRDSLLADLLSKQTRMPVMDVSNKLRAQPDHVYVMPPNVSMGITKGAFSLVPRHEERLPIDAFLRSLAEERKGRAIAVILSGTASDGTLGVAAIKAEGGIVLAQEPRSAAFDGMPRSAIASGCVDFVLPPDRIAQELARISRHPYINHLREDGPAIEDAPVEPGNDFARVLGLLQKSSAVDFRKYKPNTIHRRMTRRMMLHKLSTVSEYIKYLRNHSEETESLFNDILIPVTEFFRDTDAFEVLKSKVYPAILKDKSNQGHIRIWAPGCSSGEETYSLAITLLEFLGERASSFQVQVFGTDISGKGISKARAGIYPDGISQYVSAERLRRFFVKVEEGYRVNKAVRDMCVFARQDLTADPPFSQMNLVVCRNLLIYMGSELQQRVFPVLHYALKPSGFLFLGHSESAASCPHLFAPVDKSHRIFAKCAVASRLHFDYSTTQYPVETGIPSSTKNVPTRLHSNTSDLQVKSDQIVLRDYSPAGVVINDAMEIVQFRGQTSPYLEPVPGKASLNILKLARKELGAELRQAINAVRRKRAPVTRKDIVLRRNGHAGGVDLTVIPLDSVARERDRNYLVLFEGSRTPIERRAKGVRETSKSHDVETARLRHELETAQDSLRIAIDSEEAIREEFQSANEEVLSANEELQSTNEELETSKEELQSTNEELNTVNEELNHRNQDLNQLTNDLTNLMNSTRIPVVMLDQELRIRRFTATAGTLLKVLPSDIGRPITDIRLNIKLPGLDRMIGQVLESLHASEHEVQDSGEHWYSLQIHPYRTTDNRIDGVVLALIDVDVTKKANEQLRRSTEFLSGIISTVREPLLVLDSDLRVIAANDSFLHTFLVSRQETVNNLLYRLGDEQWNIPRLRALLEQVLPQSEEVSNFEVEHDFPKIGHRIMVLNARRLLQVNERDPMILLAIEDITQRRLATSALVKAEKLASAGRVAASLAHEINNPLQSVSNLMELLKNHAGLDDEARSYALLAEKELRRVVHLIGQSLGFYRESSTPTTVNMPETLDNIVELYGRQFEQKQIEIVKQYETSGSIRSFPGELRQIITALLVNALEATGEGGAVTLRATSLRDGRNPKHKGVRITVSDTGVGIPKQALAHVFEPFFTTKGERGTGLGLWVTHGIVNRLGGTIRVRSRSELPRTGTCVSVFLPDQNAKPMKKS